MLPTDTVYGIAANAFDARAVERLLAAKGRGRQQPPPVLVAGDGGQEPAGVPRPSLGTPVEARRLGLPVVLAVVLAGGVLSLLVRLLLAEAPPRTATTTSP